MKIMVVLLVCFILYLVFNMYLNMMNNVILFYVVKIEELKLIWKELLNVIYICFVVVIVFVFFVLLMCIIYKKYMWVY